MMSRVGEKRVLIKILGVSGTIKRCRMKYIKSKSTEHETDQAEEHG